MMLKNWRSLFKWLKLWYMNVSLPRETSSSTWGWSAKILYVCIFWVGKFTKEDIGRDICSIVHWQVQSAAKIFFPVHDQLSTSKRQRRVKCQILGQAAKSIGSIWLLDHVRTTPGHRRMNFCQRTWYRGTNWCCWVRKRWERWRHNGSGHRNIRKSSGHWSKGSHRWGEAGDTTGGKRYSATTWTVSVSTNVGKRLWQG